VSSPQAQVRRAGAEQWQVYRAVRLAALAEASYAFMSTLERERGYDDQLWRRRLATGPAVTFLAWRGEQAVGTATGKPDNPAEEFSVPGAWQLVGMWVSPAARGTGVASRLVDAIGEHARSAGAPALTLWVTQVNGRALAFYAREGFVPTGARQLVRPEEPDHWELQMIKAFDMKTRPNMQAEFPR
jgi:GNAT superfamily N-acetyltransferase